MRKANDAAGSSGGVKPDSRNTAAVDPSRCPLCGKENRCGRLAGLSSCWCQTVSVPRSVLDRIPAEARGVACVCRECATQPDGGTGEETEPSVPDPRTVGDPCLT